MSLVPFTASNGASKDAVPLSRQGTTSSKAAVTPPVSRGHATARADSATSTRRHAARFAHVLAAVQQHDDTPAATVGESRAATRRTRVGGPEPETSADKSEDAGTAVATPAEQQSAARPQTPWLLLALGAGVQARADESAGTCDTTETVHGTGSEAVSDQSAATTVATNVEALPPSAVVAPVLAAESGLVVPSAAGVAVPSGPSVSRVGAAEPFAPDASATAALTSAVEAVGQGVAADQAVDAGDPLDLAAEEVLETASPSEAADVTSAAPPVDLARWRAATRASDGDRTVPALVRADSGAGQGTAAAPTAGQAAIRLAHALGRARSQGADAAGIESSGPVADVSRLNLEGPGAAPGLATPSSRASEVLMRLAQAGGHAGDGRDGGSPPSLVPVLAPPAGPMAVETAPAGPAAPALPPEVADQVIQQVVSSLKMQWKDGVGEAKLHLRPDALGSVSVTLRVEGGAVTAVVRAENSQVQEWVLQHQQTLRQQMEAAGLHLDELVVSPDDPRQQAREESSPEPQRRRQRGTARTDDSAEAPRFELRA